MSYSVGLDVGDPKSSTVITNVGSDGSNIFITDSTSDFSYEPIASTSFKPPESAPIVKLGPFPSAISFPKLKSYSPSPFPPPDLFISPKMRDEFMQWLEEKEKQEKSKSEPTHDSILEELQAL